MSFLLLLSSVAWAGGPDVSSEEYAMYVAWKDGREDPRLEKLNDKSKMKKIARQEGVRLKDLKAVIEKVEPIFATLVDDTKKAVRVALDTTPLKGRVLDVIAEDAGNGHVVIFIKWRCGDTRDADKEAAYAGWAVGDSAKLAKTMGVWCVNEGDTKLFSAKASASTGQRISKSSIERFASSRYIKLFEDVKRGPHK